ncbi:MAG: pseudouridine synthase [Leptolyngbyaceae cyanobacterium bins.59]|nr:pseudouridine synthase [Leptolyngbyaceae cyanobacterium bins.59]
MHLSVPYQYEGRCPATGEWLRLPRTPEAEAIARQLMHQFAQNNRDSQEGKMYGVLLVETPEGKLEILKAFSGLLQGRSQVEGWVPPIPGREQVAFQENQTLQALAEIKQELIQLQQRPDRAQYQTLSQAFTNRLQALAQIHQHRKQARQARRQELLTKGTGTDLAIALEQLDQESRRDKRERRQLKQEQTEVLQPLQQVIQQIDDRLRDLKQQRKALSHQLQAQMHATYWLTNFAGESLSLQQLIPQGMPTGTGDCCAPKLLHYAATHHLKPLAMAEFWWGPSPADGSKVQGEFYGACEERCQPLMGFLLAGLPRSHPTDHPLPVLYEDDCLIAINKPSGLLSVPGRSVHTQDSVLTRLRHLFPENPSLVAVHRLDQETSGILLLAKHRDSDRHLRQQFEQRTIHKCYEAILSGTITQQSGTIKLFLWGDPNDRPRQQVNRQWGKPSVTQFQVLTEENSMTRIEFLPLTGRTHQLRVHAADPQGLGIPILGDRLYGCRIEADRLHLHAREIQFAHPKTGQRLTLRTEVPF